MNDTRTIRLGRSLVAGLVLVVVAAGCDTATPVLGPDGPVFNNGRGNGSGGGKGGDDGGDAALYQLRFIVEDSATQGEVTSPLFPEGGIALDARNPWRRLEVSGAAWTFIDHTRGTRGAGTCTIGDLVVDWDIEGTDGRTFAGDWTGTVRFSQRGGATDFYLDGVRTVGVGGIHNIASNRNNARESSAGDGSWYRIRFTDAGLAFGGASYPDEEGTLSELGQGKAVACANFTVEAVRVEP